MKASLLCLITSIDLEDHNVTDLVKAYRKFDKDTSIPHLNLIIRRGMTIVLNRLGVNAVKAYLHALKQEIPIDPDFLSACDAAFKKDEMTDIHLSEKIFRDQFLSHVRDRFTPPVVSFGRDSEPSSTSGRKLA